MDERIFGGIVGMTCGGTKSVVADIVPVWTAWAPE